MIPSPSLMRYFGACPLDFGPVFFRFADFPPEGSWASRVLAPFALEFRPAVRGFSHAFLVE